MNVAGLFKNDRAINTKKIFIQKTQASRRDYWKWLYLTRGGQTIGERGAILFSAQRKPMVILNLIMNYMVGGPADRRDKMLKIQIKKRPL